jgi:uncharacterized membrane protein (DUF485 family)
VNKLLERILYVMAAVVAVWGTHALLNRLFQAEEQQGIILAAEATLLGLVFAGVLVQKGLAVFDRLRRSTAGEHDAGLVNASLVVMLVFAVLASTGLLWVANKLLAEVR